MPSRRSAPVDGGLRLGDPRARVHVAAVGFEVERVVEPIARDRADRAYLVTRADRDDAAAFVEEVDRRLRRGAWPIDVRIVRTELWDVFGALAAYRQIFEAERRLERRAEGVVPLQVNVSTGTKITAIAGTLACMLWRGEPYYVRVSRAWYTGHAPKVRPINDVVDTVEPVGVYELRQPSVELVDVLEALQRRGGSLRKHELLRELRLERGDAGAGAPRSSQAAHGLLRRRLEPLERRWGFVRVDPGGPRGRVHLTEQGKVALVLFGRRRAEPTL